MPDESKAQETRLEYAELVGYIDPDTHNPHVSILSMHSSSDIQSTIFRQMTPEEKWKAATRLYWSAWGLKEAYLRALHPEWTVQEVNEELTKWMASGSE